VNVSIGHDHWREVEFDPELLERNRDRGESLAGLHDGERELPAGQKTGFLAIDGNEVGLRQNLEQVLGLQSFNHGPEVDIRLEQKKIQNIIDGFSG
jgi:hypothetical protein